MRRLLVTSLTAILLAAAPAAASDSVTSFASPSKSIGCIYDHVGGTRQVRCDLLHVDHPKPAPASCQLDYGDAFVLGAHGRAKRLCHGDTALDPHARVLAYGTTKRFGPLTCRVRKTTGMRCTSRSGHGFRLSRQHQKLW